MRAGSKEFHAANPPPENRSQLGQVWLTLPWAWINKLGTEICSGDDPEGENHSQRLWQLQSVLAQQNSATGQQENFKLCPNSLVFQQGTQIPRASCPSPVSPWGNHSADWQESSKIRFPWPGLFPDHVTASLVKWLNFPNKRPPHCKKPGWKSTCLPRYFYNPKNSAGGWEVSILPEESTTCPACY